MELNIIHNEDCVTGMAARLATEAVDLVVADPPYFKVVGEKWDYAWRTESDYLEWSREWIAQACRALRKGGSFYVFGYFRMLCRLLPLLESSGMELRQQIVINKGMQAVSGRATKNYKMYPNVTESILFLVKDSKPFVKQFLKSRRKEMGLSAKHINEQLGVKANGGGMWSIYTGENICKQLPTKEIWEKLQSLLDFALPYESISQTYNAQMGVTDVWDDINFYGENGRVHPTQKPLPLISRLVLASSNANDVVLDPFMGSGTTAVACRDAGRNYIGFESDGDYCKQAADRLGNKQMQLSM